MQHHKTYAHICKQVNDVRFCDLYVICVLIFSKSLASITGRDGIMIVTCAICGHIAHVNPCIAPINGKFIKKVYSNVPKIWICDTHQL